MPKKKKKISWKIDVDFDVDGGGDGMIQMILPRNF